MGKHNVIYTYKELEKGEAEKDIECGCNGVGLFIVTDHHQEHVQEYKHHDKRLEFHALNEIKQICLPLDLSGRDSETIS